MRFERVDATTIKCFLSNEEMEEYQVEYTDFIGRTQKAQELMHEIISKAHDEVGYEPPKFAFEMQIMMVPEQGIVLTFSEKEPFDISDDNKVEQFLNHLKEVAHKLLEYKAGMQGNTNQAEGAALTNLPISDKKAKKQDKIKLPQVNEAVFAFINISEIMDFIDGIPENLRIDSKLYKMNDAYFLYIAKGRASYDRFSRTCVQALEFANLYRADVGCDDILKEHGECLIEEKAIRHLRGKK